MHRTVSFTLNGNPAQVTTDDERKLLWVLRGSGPVAVGRKSAHPMA